MQSTTTVKTILAPPVRLSHTEHWNDAFGPAGITAAVHLDGHNSERWWLRVDGDATVAPLRPYRSRDAASAAYRRYIRGLAAEVLDGDADGVTTAWEHTDVVDARLAGDPCPHGCPTRAA